MRSVSGPHPESAEASLVGDPAAPPFPAAPPLPFPATPPLPFPAAPLVPPVPGVGFKVAPQPEASTAKPSPRNHAHDLFTTPGTSMIDSTLPRRPRCRGRAPESPLVALGTGLPSGQSPRSRDLLWTGLDRQGWNLLCPTRTRKGARLATAIRGSPAIAHDARCALAWTHPRSLAGGTAGNCARSDVASQPHGLRRGGTGEDRRGGPVLPLQEHDGYSQSDPSRRPRPARSPLRHGHSYVVAAGAGRMRCSLLGCLSRVVWNIHPRIDRRRFRLRRRSHPFEPDASIHPPAWSRSYRRVRQGPI